METLRYNELDVTGLSAQVDKAIARLRTGDFRGAEVKKLKPTQYYRAKLNDTDRLLFRFGVNVYDLVRLDAMEENKDLDQLAEIVRKLRAKPPWIRIADSTPVRAPAEPSRAGVVSIRQADAFEGDMSGSAASAPTTVDNPATGPVAPVEPSPLSGDRADNDAGGTASG